MEDAFTRRTSREALRSTSGRLLLLLVLLATTACVHWDDEYWSFPLSRRAYARQTMTGWGETTPASPVTDPDIVGFSGGAEELWIVPIVLLLPVAVDLLILPITLVHDLFLVD